MGASHTHVDGRAHPLCLECIGTLCKTSISRTNPINANCMASTARVVHRQLRAVGVDRLGGSDTATQPISWRLNLRETLTGYVPSVENTRWIYKEL